MVGIPVLLLAWAFLTAAPAGVAAGEMEDRNRLHAYLYRNDAFNQPRVLFSPYDRIVLSVKFVDLPAGPYRFQADWFNAFGELQESATFSFFLETPGDYALESWLKMKRAGMMRQLTSVSEISGFHVKFYGKWRVEIFLNGELAGERSFEVGEDVPRGEASPQGEGSPDGKAELKRYPIPPRPK